MGDGVRVFIGLEKNDTLELKPLNYIGPNPQTLDDAFSEVIFRDRSSLKPLFNAKTTKEFEKAHTLMSIEGLYSFRFYEDVKFDNRFGWDSLKPDILIFFLNSKTQWCIGGNIPHFNLLNYDHIGKPRLLKDVLKGYYQNFYPEEVTKEAFKDPKNIKRVISCSLEENHECFVMESLFLLNDEITLVKVPL